MKKSIKISFPLILFLVILGMIVNLDEKTENGKTKNRASAEIGSTELIGTILPTTNQMLTSDNFDFIDIVTPDTVISGEYGGVFVNTMVSQYKVNEDGIWKDTPKKGFSTLQFSDVVYLKNCYFSAEGETPIVKIDVGQYKSAVSTDKWSLVWAKGGIAYQNAFSVVGNATTVSASDSNGFNARYNFFDEFTMEPKVVKGTSNFSVGSNTSYWFANSFERLLSKESTAGSTRVFQGSIVGEILNVMNFSASSSNNVTGLYTGTGFHVAMSYRQSGSAAPTINYVPELAARMNFPPPKTSGVINEETNNKVMFDIRQLIPYNSVSETGLIFSVPIDDFLDGNSMVAEVYNISGVKQTGVTQRVENNRLIISISNTTASSLRDSIFADIKISALLKSDLDIARNMIEEDGSYYIETENRVFINSDQIKEELSSNITNSRVRVEIPISGVNIDSANAQIIVDDEFNLKATVFPEEALNKSVQWTSSDESIASVMGEGLSATVIGHSPGIAEITVTTDDGGYTATSIISVVSPIEIHQSVSRVDGRSAEEVNLGDELVYTSLVNTSLVIENPAVYYQDFIISLQVDESLEDVSQLKLTNLDGVELGNIEYNGETRSIKGEIIESDQVDWSEDMIVTYHAKVKQDIVFGTEIKSETVVSGSYTNGMSSRERISNQVHSLVEKGELIFVSSPAELKFEAPAKISSKVQEYPLMTTSEQLKVKDLRGIGSTWRLKAKMTQVLTHSNGSELRDAVYYRKNGIDQLLGLNVEALIYETTTFSTDMVTISDDWEAPLIDTQPFVRVQGGEALKGSYIGVIQWVLEDVPGS